MSSYIDEFLSSFQIAKSANFELKYNEELQKRESEVKIYKPDRKIIEFLTPLQVKQHKVSRLLGKYIELLPELALRADSLRDKPLSEKVCNYCLKFFEKKGIKL